MTASRFAGIGRTRAIAIVAALLALITVSIWRPDAPASAGPTPPTTRSTERDADLLLYKTINARLAAGDAYYPAVAEELRAGNYPLKPFVTFRLPTLAWLSAAAGPAGTLGLLWLLAAATLALWWRRLDGAFDDPSRRITGVLLVGAGASIVAQPQYAVVHEIWAGLLMAMALAVHRPDRWALSVALGAGALFVRELALPFVLLMGAFAVWGRRWRECAAWAAVAAAFGLALWQHAGAVAQVVAATDPASPGWASIGGWPTFLRTMTLTTALRVLPHPIAATGVVLALFGWLSWRTRTGLIGAMSFAGYGLAFMLFGRPDNFYWGLIVAPAFLLGLAFLPRAVADLRAAIMPPRAQLDSARP
jgi:hypothetical protein